MVPRSFSALLLVTVLALVIAACGESAAPTATAPAPTATATQAAAPTPPPASTARPDAPVPAVSGYPPERVKEMLAQSMFLPTMTWGLGETPQYGGEAVYSNKADPQNDDPMLSGSITVRNVFGAVTGDGGLVMHKRTQNDDFAGYLAESWTMSKDTRTWTFKLRPGVKWHDGDPLVAEDIKWYYDVAVKPPKGRRAGGLANALPGLVEVKAIDPMTVQLVFKEDSPHLLEALSSYSYTIAHQRKRGQAEIDKGNVTFGMVALGGVSVGPFKWDGYVKGSSFHAIRSDIYFEKDAAGRALPYLDSVRSVMIPDKIVTLSAFRAGRIDAMSRGIGASPDPDMMALIKKSLGETVWYQRYPYLNNGLSMNIHKAPFDDVRVRRAVNLYIDRDEGCKKMYGGFCYGTGFTVPGVFWYSQAYVDWPGFNAATKKQDQEAAKKIIREIPGLAGMKVEQSCRIDYTFNAEFNEQVLRSLGFDPKINCMDIQLHEEYQQAMKWHTSTAGSSSGGFPSLRGFVTTAVNSTTQWNDKKIDAWDDIIQTSLDPMVRRKALWEAEHHILVDMAYQAPYWREEVLQPYRTYIKGPIVPGWAAHANIDRSSDWIDKAVRDKGK